MLTATVVIAPLLAFSETTVKAIMDRWLSQCIIVIENSQAEKDAPIVRMHTFGEMPVSMPLTFAVDEGQLERVSLLNHVEQETTRSGTNLLVHPLANQRCPGDLCPSQADPAEKLTVRLQPLSSNYLYQFRVITSAKLPVDRLKVYVRPLRDEVMPCRVERASASNFLARQSKPIQLVVLLLGLVAFTALMSYFGKSGGPAK